jgi:hypothetical protein
MTIESLAARIDQLEIRRGTNTILVTCDGGKTYTIPGSDRSLTRAEADALPGEVTVIRVANASQQAKASQP